MPLRAVLNGNSFYAWNLSEDNRGILFKCPECNDDFIIVLPKSDIIKHFRHKTNAEHKGERETPLHLEMKTYIMNCAEALSLKCDLEIRFNYKDFLHITDAVIYKNEGTIKGYSIECQYSNISSEDYENRNKVYRENGFIPIWILGGEKYGNSYPSQCRLEALIYKEAYICFYYENKALWCYSPFKNDGKSSIDLESILNLMLPLSIEQRKIIIENEKRRKVESQRTDELRYEGWKRKDELKNIKKTYLVKCSKCGFVWHSFRVPCASHCPKCKNFSNLGVFPFDGLNYTIPKGVTS